MSAAFTPYEKMGSKEADWGLDERGHRTLKGQRWVVTEKVHGAHFALVSDGKTVLPAKRKQLLAADDRFFNFQKVMRGLIDPVRSLFAELHGQRADLERVIVHGELFGGAYPHPEVEPNPDVQPIQTGVYYCPNVEFCAFDVAVETDGERRYLGYDQALPLLNAQGIMALPPLLVGSWAEVMAFGLPFVTTLPALFGLPPIDDNWAEGVVIKPESQVSISPRPILKRKIERFAEDQRYHQARAWATSVVELAPMDEMEEAIRARVNKNRLDAARSKIGQVTRADEEGMVLLREELIEDVRAEVVGVAPRAVGALSEEELALVWSVLEDEVQALLERELPEG